MDDRREIIERWIIKAERDYQTARTMLQANPVPTDVVCFHCQQCAEKWIKAFLVFKDLDIPRTHDLQRLHTLCIQCSTLFEQIEDACILLSDYAVEIRYIDDWRDIPFVEAQEALKQAEKIKEFIRRFIIL